jgi:nucleoside-diphosphate-sugar epimerase
MVKVLVTGGNGFIGRPVVRAVSSRGFDVHVMTRSVPSVKELIGVSYHQCDLFDEASVVRVLGSIKPAMLIHLAWDTTHSSYWNSATNLDWLSASLSLIRQFVSVGGERVILAGSSAEYEWGGTGNLKECSSKIAPQSLYGLSKASLYNLSRKWCSLYGVSMAWMRFFNVFGPFESPERLIPRLILGLSSGQRLDFDDAQEERDFMHVEDVGAAVAALLDSSVEGAVNVASGQATRVCDVLKLVAIYLKKEEKLHLAAGTQAHQRFCRVVADTDRLLYEVGWHPLKDLECRIAETCDWWTSFKKT